MSEPLVMEEPRMSDGDKITVSREELRSLIAEAVESHDTNRLALTEDDVERVARTTVQEMLMSFGVDHTKPLELQQDFARLREWRRSMDALKGKTLWAVLSFVILALLGAAAVGFKVWMGRTP